MPTFEVFWVYLQSENKVMFVSVFVGFVVHSTSVQLSPKEHSDYKWTSFREAIILLEFAKQKRILLHVHEHFVLKDPNPIHSIPLKQQGFLCKGRHPESH
jgi:hypothetical protein